jgi:hypothetical protein
MLPRLILATIALVGFVVQVDAQQVEHVLRARLVGRVTSGDSPTTDAHVELLRGTVTVRSSRTNAAGEFEFDDVPTGDYRLRIRKIGLAAHEQQIRVPVGGDSIQVMLRAAPVVRDSMLRAEFERQLAIARSRPRRWSCRVSARDVRETAPAAFEQLVGSDAAVSSGNARKYGVPVTRVAFLRDFRSVRDPHECRRLAEALDRQVGLVKDQLRVFRVGSVYFLPDWGDGGMVVGLDGAIRAIFIVPS